MMQELKDLATRSPAGSKVADWSQLRERAGRMQQWTEVAVKLAAEAPAGGKPSRWRLWRNHRRAAALSRAQAARPAADRCPMTERPAQPSTRPYLLVSILVLVNSAGIWGQTGWGLEHVAPTEWDVRARLALALGFAAALELIGVFLARMADQAEAVELPAGGYRLGSYAVGLAVGALNFSHFLDRSVAMAISFGLLSAASPFLWGIYSTVRRGHPAAPSRRFWHPLASVKLIRFMAWEGIASEEVAIARMADGARRVASLEDERGLSGVETPDGRGVDSLNTLALVDDLDRRNDGACDDEGPHSVGDLSATEAIGDEFSTAEVVDPEPVAEPVREPVNRSRPQRVTPRSLTAAQRVTAAHAKEPAATHERIAELAEVSVSTVKRHRPTSSPSEPPPAKTAAPVRVNGRKPELADSPV